MSHDSSERLKAPEASYLHFWHCIIINELSFLNPRLDLGFVSWFKLKLKGRGTVRETILSSNFSYWLFQGGASFMDLFWFCACLCHTAMSFPFRKGLISWLSCMWCVLVLLLLSHTVSWVRCATWLYRFLILAFFLTLIVSYPGHSA